MNEDVIKGIILELQGIENALRSLLPEVTVAPEPTPEAAPDGPATDAPPMGG